MDRNKEIVRVSIVGIATNVMLAVFKAIVGFISGSIAIIMDAVNNLSDAMSSVITIIGTKLSERPADRMHPFGYGRVEYFSAIIISVIVLTTGITSFVESLKKIFNPTTPDYTTLTLVIIIVAIVAKLVLGRYVKSKGEKLSSDSLIASGSDALFDAIITLSTLVSAVIMLLWNVSIDGILGTLIPIVIIKSGIDMLKSPINQLLGSRVSGDFVKELKYEVMKFEGVNGVYDVILHTYGPDTIIGSFNINVFDTMKASEIHHLERKIALYLFEKLGLIASIGIYAVNTGDTEAARMQEHIMSKALNYEGITSAHGFYVDFEEKVISFDIIPDYSVSDSVALRDSFIDTLTCDYPEFIFNLVIDNNYSEE